MFRNATISTTLNSRILLSHVRTIPTRRAFTSTHTPYAEASVAPANAKPTLNDFRRPLAKCFLGAMLTYQILYWTWLKLETDEDRENKLAELSRLEAEVRRLTEKKGDA